MDIRQKKIETVKEYSERFHKAVAEIDDVDEKILVKAFANGLAHPRLAGRIATRAPQTHGELAEMLHEFLKAEIAENKAKELAEQLQNHRQEDDRWGLLFRWRPHGEVQFDWMGAEVQAIRERRRKKANLWSPGDPYYSRTIRHCSQKRIPPTTKEASQGGEPHGVLQVPWPELVIELRTALLWPGNSTSSMSKRGRRRGSKPPLGGLGIKPRGRPDTIPGGKRTATGRISITGRLTPSWTIASLLILE